MDEKTKLNNNLTKEITYLNKNIDELKQDKERLTKELNEKSQELDIKKNLNIKQNNEIKDLNSNIKNKEEEIQRINEKLESSSNLLKEKEKTIFEKEKLISDLSNNNTSLINENNSLKYKYEELKKEFESSKLQDIIKDLTQKNIDLENKLANITKENKTNQFNLEIKSKECNQFKSSNECQEKQISQYEKDILSQKEDYNKLYEEKKKLVLEKDNLDRELNNYKNKNESLSEKIKTLEKSVEELSNNSNKSKILDSEVAKLKNDIIEKDKSITELKKIADEKREDLKYDQKEFSPEKFYDIIININSLKGIKKGWEIKWNSESLKDYNSLKKNKSLRVGVIGNGNKGKSFILQKFSGKELPKGTNVKTQGLSLLYPRENEMKNILLLDSAGFETPLLDEKDDEGEEVKVIKNQQNCETKEKGNTEIESDSETNTENENKNKIISDNENENSDSENNDNNKNSENNYRKISEIAKDKIFTELFLQKLIIEFSDILLIVVGHLTFSEQKLLNRIKKNLSNNLKNTKSSKNQKIFIIHNLQNFVEKYQVEDYINEVLLKSATFQISKKEKISFNTKEEESKEEKNKEKIIFYTENFQGIIIFHFIMANDYSPAGKFYNENTINFIRQTCSVSENRKGMDIINKTKENFVKFSKEVFEYNTSLNTNEKVELVSLKNEDLIFDENDNKNKIKK